MKACELGARARLRTSARPMTLRRITGSPPPAQARESHRPVEVGDVVRAREIQHAVPAAAYGEGVPAAHGDAGRERRVVRLHQLLGTAGGAVVEQVLERVEALGGVLVAEVQQVPLAEPDVLRRVGGVRRALALVRADILDLE